MASSKIVGEALAAKLRKRPTKASATTAGSFVAFTVDAALLRELGERLVGKPEVALAELVKNSYDADAKTVVIRFSDDAIEIVDDGRGMDRRDFSRYWMRVGTTHKQSTPTTGAGRTVTGSKGVGRLSVQFLGSAVEIASRISASAPGFKALVDWKQARRQGDLIRAGARLSPVSKSALDGSIPNGHGTAIRISDLQQTWGAEEIKGLARELWFLNPPLQLQGKLAPSQEFKVTVEGLDAEERKTFDDQLRQAIDGWIAVIKGKIEQGRDGKEASVSVQFRDGEKFRERYSLNRRKLQEASFEIRVYKLSGRQAGKVSLEDARNYFKEFGGVHIYDDGFRLPFYGGADEDWLGLEVDHSHRLTVSRLLPESLHAPNAMNDLPTNSRIFGLVQVSTSSERRAAPTQDVDKGRYLNVQITRDRLIENDAFRDLRQLVRWGVDFYASRSSFRKMATAAEDYHPPPDSSPLLLDVKGRLDALRVSVPTAAPAVKRIEKALDGFLVAESARQQALSKERILLGALATAGMGAIAIEHELGKELLVLGETLSRLQSRPSDAEELQGLLLNLRGWMERVNATHKLFQPLMEQSERETASSLRAKRVLDIVVKNSRALLRGILVDLSSVDDQLRLPIAPLTAWQAVFQNVLVNGVNAMIQNGGKRMRCRSVMGAAGERSAILVEDDGAGVDVKASAELFKPFVRKLEISDDRKALGLGGVGLGLTIVRMVAESVNCKVEFTAPAQGYASAFKISWEAQA